jgi:hypothetical protein
MRLLAIPVVLVGPVISWSCSDSGAQLTGYRAIAIEPEPPTARKFVPFQDKPTLRLIDHGGGAAEQPFLNSGEVAFRSAAITTPQKSGFISQERARMVRPHLVPVVQRIGRLSWGSSTKKVG